MALRCDGDAKNRQSFPECLGILSMSLSQPRINSLLFFLVTQHPQRSHAVCGRSFVSIVSISPPPACWSRRRYLRDVSDICAQMTKNSHMIASPAGSDPVDVHNRVTRSCQMIRSNVSVAACSSSSAAARAIRRL